MRARGRSSLCSKERCAVEQVQAGSRRGREPIRRSPPMPARDGPSPILATQVTLWLLYRWDTSATCILRLDGVNFGPCDAHVATQPASRTAMRRAGTSRHPENGGRGAVGGGRVRHAKLYRMTRGREKWDASGVLTRRALRRGARCASSRRTPRIATVVPGRGIADHAAGWTMLARLVTRGSTRS